MRRVTSFILSAILTGMSLNAGIASAHSNDHKDRENLGGHHTKDWGKKHRKPSPDARLLEPRSLPYALAANAGTTDVNFSVHLINDGDNNPRYVFLQEKDDGKDKGWHNGKPNVYKLNDQGHDGDKIAGDNVYSATVSIDTGSRKRKGHYKGREECLEYRAFAFVGKYKIQSPDYSLCATSFPAGIAESNTGSGNLVVTHQTASPAVADELLVRFDENAGEQLIRAAARAAGAQVVGSILPRNLYQFRFPQALTATQLAARIQTLENRPGVESAYLNRVGRFAALPNDAEYLSGNQHGYTWISADDAWDLGGDGAGVTIAVLDSGVSAHADLPPVGGPADAINHGTPMAGIAAAITDNAAGIAGAAGNSTLESVQVSPDAGVTMAEMVAGFQTVASSSTAQVVIAGFNTTLAPPASNLAGVDDQWDLCLAINDVVLNAGTPVAVVVSAAGNNNSNSNHYPSRCNDATHPSHAGLTNKSLLITVMGSVTCNSGCTPDTRQADSNYGAWIDVAAPAQNLRSTNNAGGYSDFSGTSYAAALVAGSAAQMLSCGTPVDQVQTRLTGTAPVTVVHPAGSSPRIDVHAAVLAGNTAPTNINLSGSTSINENTNTGAGHVIGTLAAVDANICDDFSYNIQGGADAAFFSIGGPGMNQLILTAGVLNFEAKSSYGVTVRATDAGGSVFDRAFVITVNNLNEAPVVNNQTFSIAENSVNGTSVGTVVATDPDAAATLTYSITAGNTGGAFAINAGTGALTVNTSAALNFEATPSFALTVQVSDGVLNDTATITVNLTNANEAPVVNNQTFSIAENSPNGTSVGTVVATDPDAAATLTYSITAGNTGGAFNIVAGTGLLRVNTSSALNFEAIPSFALTVQVSDGVLTDTAIVTVNLTNANEAPVVNNQTFSIAENSANGTSVGTVVATDPDAGTALSYSITAGNTGGAFAINPGTGALTVNSSAALNFETTPSFALTVQVSDGVLNDTSIVTVNLTNSNEAPVVNNQTFSVAENAPNGTSVGTVVATDPDAATTLTYSITAGNTGGAFAINPGTGALTVNTSSALNFETSPSFALTVQVSDGALTDTATVTVNLTNANEAPVVNNQTFSVAENSANGTTVGTVVATDPDAGTMLSYSITAGNTGGAFNIVAATGVLRVNTSSALNFETTPSFALTVQVSDGVLTDTATVTVNLTNANETPVVNNQTFSIAENAPNGASVGTVVATDPDAGTSLSYSITAGNTGGAFAINPGTGALTVNTSSALNFETTPSFALTVQVSDGTLTDTATVTVNLSNANEAPVVNNQTFTVAENSANGTVVGTVAASDPDAATVLTYSITAGNTGGAFAIGAGSGTITVASSAAVDFETTPSFALTVQVSDGTLTDTATVTVNVNNVPENTPPVVNNQSFSVNENSPNGTTVGTVAATDAEGDPLSFSITAGNTGGAFAIGAGTGVITVSNSSVLDFETTPSFALIVEVSDGTLTDTASVTVNLNNVVENTAPVANNQTFSIAENSANGTAAGTVVATDAEGDALNFSITAGNIGGAFAIGAGTGVLTVNNSAALDFETTPSFALTVEVSDGLLTDTATVTVNLTNVVENTAPVVNNQSFSINENSANGTPAGTVIATDAEGDPLSFSITAGNTGGAFAIDVGTGVITVNNSSVLDFETMPSFALTVQVSDGVLNDTATVTINLNNLVENTAPVVNNQTFSVAENSANGTPVGTVIASDAEGNPLSFSITAGNTGGAFAIGAGTGVLTVNSSAALDFETTPSFALTVQVSDGSLSDTATVTVNLTDVVENTAPVVNNQTFGINENSANGTVVGTVIASDGEGDPLSFSITAGNTGGAFAIGAGTGVLTVNNSAALDFETTPSFALTVQVSDGSLTDTATVTVNLNDLAEAIPNPVIDWVLPVPYETYTDAFGNPYVRYRFEVTNRSAYPDEMFEASPGLPPCGLNTSAARTWVYIYNGATDAYIYGFCALGIAENLGQIWFAIPVGGTPPPSIYITLIDRLTSTVYTSNTLTVP